MRSYSLVAPAKINLYLQIVGDRPDGFHELVMVLQSIELADLVTVRPIGAETIQVRCNHPDVPQDQTNLAYKAADLMVRQFPDYFAKFGGVEINIQKRIPLGAGLAGGSSNAAAVLVGLDLMWNLGLTHSELQELGATLGSDIPFCISGGTSLATGRGEQLDGLPDLHDIYVVLAKYRDLPVSTPWAYKTYRQQFGDTYPKSVSEIETRKQQSRGMMAAIAQQNLAQIGKLLHNDLERVVLPEYLQVQQLRDRFQSLGVLGTMMSGSGSTVFGLVESQAHAEQVREQMKGAIADPNLDLWVTRFCPSGVRLATS
ncbi:4-(cytidine 5'-diphospho)-2-C-methyl-D-erythritol kinase [Phormidesmis priestleyi ULC007]|uniref:4-diphosphocytidyl-2-C-methyl-D-erythritol kinase n=1 Tax=Phormidesmis priestleyi ULC007 TaxID=1920490 RepID=A0A2T1DNZ0_9CYAN|nr:4-(cytidine 5'-diphospho)-2-C-methyl-D-erythritol kinase [Phormidesmis priestleyi]PSB22172.1 4-(cytidine 5'-diphospho)-2-C-methyl-D-erythritol kinase [Phormidesmis priestleyi ULC007]PZO52567.1 MAG: 4-(cytidine 5'-diphospho)-2-C-methyl-D-erythritol kinase [Phormidesmis priestleyi]